jgi:hypothetical protein
MRTRIRRPAAFSCLVLLAACTGGQTGDEGPNGPPDASRPTDAGTTDEDFFDSLRPVFGNYDAARSVEELAERSDVIAVGTVGSVREGRPASTGRGEGTAVLELAVIEVLAGSVAERFHIELYRGFVFDGAWLPDPLPENRLLFFLIHATAGDAAVLDGEPLYRPTTPQGMMVEREAGSIDTVDLAVAGTFDELVDRVRDAVQ